MIITNIQKTKRGRYSLFCDHEFQFSVDGETLLSQDLYTGKSIDQQQLADLLAMSDFKKVKESALRFLSLRAYGEQELYQKLCLQYDEDSSRLAVEKMVELGLLDDVLFAKEKAKGMAQRGKSLQAIRLKLYSLGIARDIVDEAVSQLDADETQQIITIIHKKYIQALQKGNRQKVMAALARLGYSHRDLADAVDTVLQELDAIPSWESELE